MVPDGYQVAIGGYRVVPSDYSVKFGGYSSGFSLEHELAALLKFVIPIDYVQMYRSFQLFGHDT